MGILPHSNFIIKRDGLLKKLIESNNHERYSTVSLKESIGDLIGIYLDNLEWDDNYYYSITLSKNDFVILMEQIFDSDYDSFVMDW